MVPKGLRVHEVQFAYPPLSRGMTSTPVLENVSLEPEPGRVIVLLGSSGCGKSTLLQVINRLLKLDSETIVWDNQDLKRTSVCRQDFAMLFQGGELFPGYDVARNIAYSSEMWHP